MGQSYVILVMIKTKYERLHSETLTETGRRVIFHQRGMKHSNIYPTVGQPGQRCSGYDTPKYTN